MSDVRNRRISEALKLEVSRELMAKAEPLTFRRVVGAHGVWYRETWQGERILHREPVE